MYHLLKQLCQYIFYTKINLEKGSGNCQIMEFVVWIIYVGAANSFQDQKRKQMLCISGNNLSTWVYFLNVGFISWY